MGDRIALGEMDGDHDEQGEFEDWDDAVEEEVRPLFSPRVIFDSVEAALAHDAQTHGFALRAHAQRLKLDFYGATRLVNFIRSEVAKVHATRGAAADPSADAVAQLASALATSAPRWADLFSIEALMERVFDVRVPEESEQKCRELAGELAPDPLNVDRLRLNRLLHQTPDLPDRS